MRQMRQLRHQFRLLVGVILAVVFTLLFAIASSTSAIAQRGPMSAHDKFVTVYGQKIHYLEAGSGPAVILLHAVGADAAEWSKVIGPLAQKYRIIAPDQVGFGESDKPFLNYRMGTLVSFLEGLYKELKIERASLVGHSASGGAAANFALAHPEKVERLALVDSGYGYAIPDVADPRQMGHAPGTLQAINPSTHKEARQLLSLAVYDKQTVASDAAVDQLFAETIRSAYANQRFIESFVRREDVLDNRLQTLKPPTLIVWGREDGITPVALGERFHREIADSELVIIDKCGHSANVERADEFNTVLMKFLDNAKG